MATVYKIPTSITPADLLQFVGTMGSHLNPVQDIAGNYVISHEEYSSAEFAYLKQQYPDVAAQFAPMEWQAPKIDKV